MDLPNLNQTPPPHTHKILWIVIGVLIVAVIVGSIYWWQEYTNSELEFGVCMIGVKSPCNGSKSENPEAWKTHTENYSAGNIIFSLPPDWTRLPIGWNQDDPIRVYDLNAYISKDSAKYNQNSLYSPRFDLTIYDIWASDKPLPVYSSENTSVTLYKVDKEKWTRPDRIEYAIKAETSVQKEVHYYILSFDKNLEPTTLNNIIVSAKFAEKISCGGFGGLPCPEKGYDCNPAGTYPDAMTICVKNLQ